jgi:hypothetical protein
VKDVPAGGAASDGVELTSWIGPAPPIGTHRYIFLLYEQDGTLEVRLVDAERCSWFLHPGCHRSTGVLAACDCRQQTQPLPTYPLAPASKSKPGQLSMV